MNNEFELLSAFLQSVEPEVAGHSAAPVSAADSKLIEKFANGELTDDQRDSLLPLLAENETALQLLADSAKQS